MFKAPNHVFKNWNKDVYVANKKGVIVDDYGNEIVIYEKPFYLGKLNYQPLTGKNLEAYKEEFGETNNNIVSCLINTNKAHLINNFDVVYLYDANPKGEMVFGDNANYIVKAHKPQNTKVMLLFEQIVKED